MMRKNAGVQHIRIGDHHVAPRTHRPASVGRGVAIISEDSQIGAHLLIHLHEFGQLILRQSLGGKHVESARGPVFQNTLQNRQIVAECFARSGRCDDHRISPGQSRFHGLRLMAIETIDSALPKGVDDPTVQPRRPIAEGGRLSFLCANRGDVAPPRLLGDKVL